MSALGQKQTCAPQTGSALAHVCFGPEADIANMCGYPSISAWRWRSVVSLRSIVIGTAKRASEKATAPLRLGIVIVRLVPAGTRLTVTGFYRPRDLILAARSYAGQYNLGILQANLLHQRKERGGILTRDTHTAMRGGSAEVLRLIGAMDGITILPKENRMRHGGVVPLFAVPDFVHRGGSIVSRWS